MHWMTRLLMAFAILAAVTTPVTATTNGPDRFEAADVFELEWATDPQISPDGEWVVYVRNFMDIMKDRRRSNLWILRTNGTHHRPLTTGNNNNVSPRWSPNGDRVLYVSTAEGSAQLHMRWMDTGETAKLTNLTEGPGALSFSPDGEYVALTMRVAAESTSYVRMPGKPDGAEWAPPPTMITKLNYRADGAGYLPDGFTHIHVVPAEGGTPRQLTTGDFNHGGPLSWAPDSQSIVFSANRQDDWERDPVESEIFEVSLADGSLSQLTQRNGPDAGPAVSPDGTRIAFVGFDDREQGYQVTTLYVMNRDGSEVTPLTPTLDRDVQNIQWGAESTEVRFAYDDQGDTKIAVVPLDGEPRTLTGALGGTALGRPYGGGSFTASKNGSVAFTYNDPLRPADIAVMDPSGAVKHLTGLNEDLLAHKRLGQVEEIWYPSSHDGRQVQGWIVTPPDFDPQQKYPLILEIHGGPFANYGPRFSAEIQLFATAGYVVLYTNPRGSTSYGGEFGNLIHHNYPGEDYDDLISGVDAVIAKGYVDPERLFVTGGSGGGVLTSWIVGKTDKFRAAVAAKPVINWYSFVLTADAYGFFYRYWFPGFPWDHAEHYMSRSPLSLVGNVSTPTMLLTGESDYRTPISESEQYYQALKLRNIDTALVRIPEASHGITARPSNLIAKVAHILKWFETH